MTLHQAVAELMRRKRVLVGVDFDGTLAPLVRHPDDARPEPRAIAAIRELIGRDRVRVVVISGRSHGDLTARIGDLPGALLIGEHGNDLGQPFEIPQVLADARSFVGQLHEQFPTAAIEQKPRSVTFHTRNLDHDDKAEVRDAMVRWATGRESMTRLEGKEVFELTVATKTKGDAIADLAVGMDGTLFLGDDVTDETVFRKLGVNDVSVKVGDGPTDAEYRVSGVAEVVELLTVAALAST